MSGVNFGLGKNLENLIDVLDKYEKEIVDVEDKIQIKGKTIEEANRENATWQHYYDHRRVELSTLVKFMDSEVNKVKSKLFRQYKENYSIALSDREIAKYIDGEAEYLTIYTLSLDIKQLHDKYQTIVNAYTTRGYALNNIVKARCAEVHDVFL